MRKSRFTENQILKILKEVQNGRKGAIDHCARVVTIEESRSDDLFLAVGKPEGPSPRYTAT